jgi:hypothetical protein
MKKQTLGKLLILFLPLSMTIWLLGCHGTSPATPPLPKNIMPQPTPKLIATDVKLTNSPIPNLTPTPLPTFVQTTYVSEIENASSYYLPKFLNTYGPPDEIWVNTFSSWTTIDGKPPFALYLFYSKRGILARYDTDAVIKGETIYACLNEITSIKLWNFNRTLSFYEAAGDFDGDKLPSSEAFGLSEKEFYEQYKNSEYLCFETPKMKWSGIDGSTPAP